MTQPTDQGDRHDEPVEDGPSSSPDSSTSNEETDEKKAESSPRKERVLHTRVPAVLEQELKRLAQSLRMPVSNVVRAILEDAVTAVDMVGRRAEGEMSRVVDRMAEKRERLRDIATGKKDRGDVLDHEADSEPPSSGPSDEADNRLEGVLGFQPLLLAATATCTVCGLELKTGTQAFVGVRDVPGPRVLIGPECLPKPEDGS